MAPSRRQGPVDETSATDRISKTPLLSRSVRWDPKTAPRSEKLKFSREFGPVENVRDHSIPCDSEINAMELKKQDETGALLRISQVLSGRGSARRATSGWAGTPRDPAGSRFARERVRKTANRPESLDYGTGQTGAADFAGN